MNQTATKTKVMLLGLFLASTATVIGCGDSGSPAAPGQGGSGGGGAAGTGGGAGTADTGDGGGAGTSVAGAGGTGTTPDGGTADASPPDPLLAVLTPAELIEVAKLSPLPAPLAIADDGTTGGLGAMGEAGKMSCASCHLGRGLDDRRSRPGNVSLGADFLTRNALPLVNSSFYRWTNWGGRFAAQWELPLAVAENARNMNGDRLRVVHLIFDKYKADYEGVFGALEPAIGTDATRFPAIGKPGVAEWDNMAAADKEIATRVFVNFGKVLEAYQRRLVSRNAPLDRFVAGNVHALGDDELRGLKLFIGAAECAACHSGPHFSDGLFHNLGLAQTGLHVPATDNGRFADVTPLVASTLNVDGAFSDDRQSGRLTGLTSTPPDEWKGQFRTPSLRGVAETGPYMHAGQLATLEDVIAFYDAGGATTAAGTKDARIKPLGLSVRERADLAAFLRALSGDPVPPALLADTSAP
jgi:cytochrome c peroxidase